MARPNIKEVLDFMAFEPKVADTALKGYARLGGRSAQLGQSKRSKLTTDRDLSERSNRSVGKLIEDASALKKEVHRNSAFEAAIQQHLEKLNPEDQVIFRKSFAEINPENLLSRVKEFDEAHHKRSSARKCIGPVGRFLHLLDQFMKGVAIGIQSQPEISSIVVGAVRVVIDIALKWVTFFNRLSEMLSEFANWLGILQQLHTTCKDNNNGILHEALANVYGDLLDFCTKARSVFTGSDGSLRKGTSFRILIQVQWKPFEDHFGGIENRVKNNLQNVLLAAQADTLTNQKDLLSKLSEHFKNSTDRKASEDRTQFLEWISQINCEDYQDRILAKKYPGTAGWITQTAEFQNWFKSSSSATLWCHGKPGAGKSVLASNIIDYIYAHHALSEHVGIAYAYCDFLDLRTQDPRQVISTFIKELCWKSKELSEGLLGFYRAHHGDAKIPNFQACGKQFWDLARSFEEIYIVIDGLDECDKADRRKILEFVLDSSQGTDNKNRKGGNENNTESTEDSKEFNGKSETSVKVVRAIFISRNENDIADVLRKYTTEATSTILIDKENVAHDIARFVQGETESLIEEGQLPIQNDDLKSKVIEKLTSEADGMFLWPRLQLDMMCKEESEFDVEMALGGIPEGLDETYFRMLNRIKKRSLALKTLAFRCFRFVLSSARPLRIEELRDAVAMTQRTTSRKDLKFYDAAVILDVCADFFVVDNSIVRPIHTSIRTFLERHLRDGQGHYVLDPALAQYELALACVLYLLLDFQKDGPCQNPNDLYGTIQANPFCFYATQYFDYHIAQLIDVHDELVQHFNDLLASGDSAIAALLQIRLLRNPFDPLEIEKGFDKSDYPVTAATMLYTTRLQKVRWLTSRARWPIHKPVKQSIHNAASAGRVDLTAQLIKDGAGVNEADGNGVQPLFYACQNGHFTAASVLIAWGADVDYINRQGNNDNPLHAASLLGFTSIARMLLDAGANPNSKGGFYGNPLVAACHNGKIETVQLLFYHGAKLEDPDGKRFTALHEAVLGGRTDLVRLLLNKGADVNEAVDERTALLVAVGARKHVVARFLIENGADVNASHSIDGTVLHVAAKNGDNETTGLLLQGGANVYKNGVWGPVLHKAVEVGEIETVRLLLQYGAEVNEVTKDETTAFQITAKEGLTEVAQLLIDNGADLKTQGTPALELAACYADVDMAQFLLNHGVDVNEGNVLEFAATSSAESSEDMVKLLINRGINVGRYDNRALRVAIAYQNDRVVEMLSKFVEKI